MGIRVECPNGHVFKVKDKYAGKKGLCPHCKGQVQVVVPESTAAALDMDEVLQMEAIQRRQAAHHQSAAGSGVLDEPHELVAGGSGTSGSLLGSSVIRHNIRCKCGEHVPMWYARCPACGEYLEH
jgi:hypothetical protein